MTTSLPIVRIDKPVYEACIYRKQHREKFPECKSWRASKPLVLVHADICGPMQTHSLNGSKYYDDFSRMI